jgi:hypothetical protein
MRLQSTETVNAAATAGTGENIGETTVAIAEEIIEATAAREEIDGAETVAREAETVEIAREPTGVQPIELLGIGVRRIGAPESGVQALGTAATSAGNLPRTADLQSRTRRRKNAASTSFQPGLLAIASCQALNVVAISADDPPAWFDGIGAGADRLRWAIPSR